MNYLEIYKKMGCDSQEKVFEYIVTTLKESNTRWDYFVDWNKVFSRVNKIKSDLSILNTLIGTDDFDQAFKNLIRKNPAIQAVIPALIASREKRFNILTEYGDTELKYETFFFTDNYFPSDEDIDKALRFVKKTGTKQLFDKKIINNIADYMVGVEVGLNSSGRKNRGGHIMEDIVENFIDKLCSERGFRYIKEATSSKILAEFGVNVPVDKSSRRYDFVIYCGKRVYIIETNFYGSAGSKLKSTAGEYKGLHDYLKSAGHTLIWVTDGIGWKQSVNPLKEAFNHIDYLVNLTMLENGVLREIVQQC